MWLRPRRAVRDAKAGIAGTLHALAHPTRHAAVDREGRDLRLPRGFRLPVGATLDGVSPGGVIACRSTQGAAITLALQVRVIGSSVLDASWSSPSDRDPTDPRARRRLLRAVGDDRCLRAKEAPRPLADGEEVTLQIRSRGSQHCGYNAAGGNKELLAAAIPIVVAWAREHRG